MEVIPIDLTIEERQELYNSKPVDKEEARKYVTEQLEVAEKIGRQFNSGTMDKQANSEARSLADMWL